EQRALRAFQYFDALELAEIAEAHAVAGAVYAIDHDADRRFEAGIVADGADAANARSRDGLARRGRHDESRREQGEILYVLNAGVLRERVGVRRYDDGHVLQALLALLLRDHDRVDLATAFLGLLGFLRREWHCGRR